MNKLKHEEKKQKYLHFWIFLKALKAKIHIFECCELLNLDLT